MTEISVIMIIWFFCGLSYLNMILMLSYQLIHQKYGHQQSRLERIGYVQHSLH